MTRHPTLPKQARRERAWLAAAGASLLLALTGRPVIAQTNLSVWTYHYDNARTGLNPNETALTPANVNPAGFGKIFSYPVDGYTYTQPLYLPAVSVPGSGVFNVVYVATQHDSVYAFDADNPGGTNSLPLWHRSFINPSAGVTTIPSGDVGTGDIVPEIGITATPVIDTVSGTLFVLAKTKEVSGANVNYVQRLHALDVATGAEKLGGPVVITASVPGNGDGSGGGAVPFNPLREHDRCALLLQNGVVYLSFASHGDNGPYHGWILGYSVTNLQPFGVYNATPNGGLGGFWMSGCGPAVDAAGNIYAVTGNGTFDANTGGADFGDTFVKLTPSGSKLTVTDWFTPFNQASLDASDADLGSGGAMVLPDEVGSAAHPHLLVGCGKEGKIYLLDRDNLGHFNASSDSQIVQFLAGAVGGTWSTAAYFNKRIYYQGSGDVLKAFAFASGRLNATPLFQSATSFGFPGATPTISANGTNNAIVWVLQTDAYGTQGPSVLHAYNERLSQELYNSGEAGARDVPGPAVKFTVPTVVNGRVYVGTANALAVYGLGTFVNTPTISPNGGTFVGSVSVTLATTTGGAQIHYTLDGSAPLISSPLYTAPLTLTNSAAVKAVAFKAGAFPSGVASATFFSLQSVGAGSGLRGEYYSNQLRTLNGKPTLTRLDPTVNFNWGNGSPDPKISVDDFTARWSGQVLAQFTEHYTFYTTTDDGVRLWINNQLVIDEWVDQSPTEWSGGIDLVAGQRYGVRMEYYENGGGAEAMLSWSSPSTTKAIIPQSQLFPSNQPPVVTWLSPTNDTPLITGTNVTLRAAATDTDGTVTSVSFYQVFPGGPLTTNGPVTKLLGTVQTSPYQLTLTNLQPGFLHVRAVATDDFGATNLSETVRLIIYTPVKFSPSLVMTNGGALIQFVGTSFQIESSTDLINWTAMTNSVTAQPDGMWGIFDNLATQTPYRFFRARQYFVEILPLGLTTSGP